MTKPTIRRPFPLRTLAMAGLTAGAAVLLAAPAHAQSTARGVTRPQVLQGDKKVTTPAPPPALPGSKPAQDTVIPSDVSPTDMAPNEALFDAINRGDVSAAKSALGRGAELEAHNVLGQTPLELSVDIGRNDISFLLLSMRSGGPRPGAPAAAAAAQAPARPPPRGARAPRDVASTRSPAAVPQSPQLFAGNGGTPVPQAGFLGFSNGRTP